MFAAMILGHLAGDYLLQNRAMMLRKTENSLTGQFWCALHCLFYTFSVCLFLGTTDPIMAAAVFLSHWPIDRWSLAAKWMKAIQSRQPGIVYKNKEIDAAFYAIVYTAADNTMHTTLMWLAIEWRVN